IHHAARLGYEPLVSLLLEHGAGAIPLDGRGLTPLHLAAREAHAGVVEILLDAGADARARCVVDGLQLPLDLAAMGGHVDVISVFTRRDLEIVNDTETATGYAAMRHAAEHNQVASIDVLVGAGANLELQDTGGCTALHVAAASPDCKAAVEALLQHGAYKEILNNEELTPLLVAIQKGHEASAMALIAAGADFRPLDTHYSALELAIESKSIDLVNVLIQNGSSPSEPLDSSGGFTPLHWAAWFDFAPAIDFLVASGANLEATFDDTGVTPFHGASQSAGNLAAIAALVSHGANIHARKEPSGDTPLHVAAENCYFEGSPGTVDALLKAGADETLVNAAGQTPADLLEFTVDDKGWSNEAVERTLTLL
ncbi:unnamed protein product, partial [Pylaiella littoralis]